MIIEYSNNKFKILCEDGKSLITAYNKKVAVNLVVLLDVLKCVNNMSQIPIIYRPHPLKGKRRGQFACDITGKYRLIFKPQNGDNINGNVEIITVTKIMVLEVSNHYDD